jgi:hypothetical protein
MPGPAATAQHGDDARYRAGCRCTDCRIAHTEVSRRWKHEQRYGPGAPLGPEVRAKILQLLKKNRSVIATAKALDLTHQSIYGACKALPDFGEQVDELTRA